MNSIYIYNDSLVLVGSYQVIFRFDFNSTNFWEHSQVYSLPGDYVVGITLHPLNKSEGFISHNRSKRFHHITFNGTHIVKSTNNNF